jgi:isopenicillin-N N-acyltransferase like protein
MSLPTLRLSGSAFNIGRQHGQQVRDRRGLLAAVIDARLAELRRLDADRPDLLGPAVEALEALDAPLVEQLLGLAIGLGVDYDRLLRYTLSSYLKDRQRMLAGDQPAAAVEGCTTWAATAPVTVSGATLLAKNRDYHLDHILLQVLARVKPSGGYGYVCIGSAGSPTVFSSGVNEQGLAVADTHVLSRDLGPGLPRFSLMREILERHTTTASALAYLRSVQHMGGGTLLLADRAGHLALCESGHRESGFVEAVDSALAGANHFVTEPLAAQWIEDEPELLVGNSAARRGRVLAELAGSAGRVDATWAQALLAAHGGPLDAICRHALVLDGLLPGPALDTSTISAVVFLPNGVTRRKRPALLLAVGQPCEASWRRVEVG